MGIKIIKNIFYYFDNDKEFRVQFHELQQKLLIISMNSKGES